MNEAQELVRLAFRCYNPSCTKAQVKELSDHLMNGGSPASYGERFAQMALQDCGLLITESEKRRKSND